MSPPVGHTSDELVRIVYEAPRLALGEFHCEPEHRRWSEENRADEGHFVVFPGTPVRIAQDGHDPVVATPNNVMFYNRHRTYRRALVSARGDHCVFVLVSPQALEEIARACVPELTDPEVAPFPFSNGPCAASTYLAHRMLLHHLRNVRAPDELFVEECMYRLVGDAVVRSFGTADQNEEPRRLATRTAHRELVEEAKLALSVRLGERLTMEDLAATLFTSPFHLARVFRQRTGFPLHAFRTQLRLRSSLRIVCDSGESHRHRRRSGVLQSQPLHRQLPTRFRRAAVDRASSIEERVGIAYDPGSRGSERVLGSILSQRTSALVSDEEGDVRPSTRHPGAAKRLTWREGLRCRPRVAPACPAGGGRR